MVKTVHGWISIPEIKFDRVALAEGTSTNDGRDDRIWVERNVHRINGGAALVIDHQDILAGAESGQWEQFIAENIRPVALTCNADARGGDPGIIEQPYSFLTLL